MIGAVSTFRQRWLPEGRALPYESWARRHKTISVILWAHVVATPVFGVARGHSFAHVATDTLLVLQFAVLASWSRGSQRIRTLSATIGLLTASAVLVHLSGGSTEMHFHFFVMIGVITLYQDWLPFLVGIAFVALHHGVMGTLDAHAVFGQPAAWNNPWKWAVIHALFILGASAAHVAGWNLTEFERKRAEAFGNQLAERHLLHQQALEINDNIVQGLVAAEAALELGDDDLMRDALAATLVSARAIVTDLLEHADADEPITPGRLRRASGALHVPLAR